VARAWPLTLALLVPGVAVADPAAAQEATARPRPPLRYLHGQPPDGSEDAPAWTWWLGAGGGVRGLGTDAGARPHPLVEARLGLGIELTKLDVGRYHQLQVGPWVQAVGDLAGALAEGGLEAALTKERDDGSFYGLRLGGGYGFGASDRGAALAASLLYGMRHTFGACAHLYHALGWRAFATVRTWPHEGHGVTIVAGLEIDPSLLFSDEDDDRYWERLDGRGEIRCVVPM